jgi:hypothetical protein
LSRLPAIKHFQDRKEEAAKAAVSEDRLLEGEDPETTYSDDARHWLDVYAELLSFKKRLISTADQSISQLSDSTARYEAAATDMTVLKAERDRLERRLRFWQRRFRQLAKQTN